MFTKGGRCSKTIFGARVQNWQCQKKAVVERNGKLYCKIHDPEYIKAKNTKQQLKWDAERIRRNDGWERNSLAREIFEDIATYTIEANKEKYKASEDMYEALKEIDRHIYVTGTNDTGIQQIMNGKGIASLKKAEGK